jgi:hypothetical protein
MTSTTRIHKSLYKLTHLLVLSTAFIFLTACGSANQFPVSNILPGADITFEKKKDDNNNYRLVLEAENLASPDRLNPPKEVYVVWIETVDGIKNVGQLRPDDDREAKLETITPYDFSEVFITAESQSNMQYPTGIEISRMKS